MKLRENMHRICALALALTMLLSVYTSGLIGVVWAEPTDAPITSAPETDAPETDAPETDAPETDAPETDAPETDAPETDAPETDAPGTDAPETDAPETDSPETDSPETDAHETDAHETDAPETDEEVCAECGGTKKNHIFPCSQALKQYVTKITDPSGNTYAISVNGVLPDGMTAAVTLPGADFVPQFDMLAKKMIFAYDITVYDADHNVWQPKNGQVLTLSIDAALVGLSENESVEIYHTHNGVHSTLGEVKVVDGKITFQTTGFSVFYGVQSIETTPEYIYFDLAAGNVIINSSTYTGYIYVTNGSTTVSQQVKGTHNNDNKYYVYQSVAGNRSITGLVDGEYVLPVYDEMYADGKAWGEYVTNNTNVKGVVAAWPTAAAAVGRTSTGNRIEITGSGNSTFYVTVDNIWSSYVTASTSRTTGGISFLPKANDAATIYLHGNTRVDNIHYSSNLNTNQIVFEDSPFPGTGTLTAASTNGSSNHYNSVIGGNDSSNAAHEASKGIVINSGNIFAGAQVKDNCSAIGGGGNGHGIVTINGGTVTAVVSSSGAAIGGGIGESSVGGKADITITGGTIYAYNFSFISEYTYLPIPAAAIGGGSTCKSNGQHANITITGGTIYAQSTGGAAIGGGSSTMLAGGSTTINISGNPTIEARSVGGSVYSVSGTSQTVAPGISIGGGTAGNASTSTGSGGYAELTVHGGTLKTGSIGGGVCNNKKGTLGYAKVTITGGTIQGQIIMAKGAAPCSFTMTGGLIDNTNSADYNFIKPDGGAVNMDDDRGVAEISGGTIRNCSASNGGAVFMTNGRFILSGGVIENCSASNYGGAVYLGGGSVTLAGGTISDCSSTTGGAIYLTGGNVTISGSSIERCFAESDNALGGAIYVSGGNVSMTNGVISNCYTVLPGTTPYEERINGLGGALYITNGEMTMSDGTITGCQSTDGAGIYLPGGNFTMTGGIVSANRATNNGAGVYILGGGNLSLSGESAVIQENIAVNGAGVYLTGGNFDMTGGTVALNVASGNGGGVYLAGGTLTLNGSSAIIRANSAVNGAGVYLTGGGPNLLQGTLSDNVASGNGGGIFIDNQIVTLAPTGTVTFASNHAADGAGMYILGDEEKLAGFSVSESQGTVLFSENVADGNGGGVCLSYGDMQISNEQIVLVGNRAKNGGGAAILTGSFTLTGGSVGADSENANYATNGGGVYVSGGNVTVSDTGTIAYNTAENGGGVFLTGGEFTLDGADAYIRNNTATFGGGVYLTQINPSLLTGNITDNSAAVSGGGIYISKQEVVLDPTGIVTISGNMASRDNANASGGGIYIEGTESAPAGFKVDNTHTTGRVVLSANQATNGGAVCVNNGYFHINHDNITITGNTAINGGGIAVLTGNFIMKDGSIGEAGRSNSAENGGGVYVAGGTVTIDNGTVAHNTAVNGGGAYVSGGELILNDGSFDGNQVYPSTTSDANGGGFFVRGGSFTMNGGSVIHNTANASTSGFGGFGGGFFIQNGSFTMNGGSVTKNTALAGTNGGLGGGGYVDGGDFIMTAGVIGGTTETDANHAIDGGGIYVSDGNVTIIDGMIQHNTAQRDGGGIFVSSQTTAVNVTMLSGYLRYNKAGAYGGGVAVRSPAGASTKITVEIGCLLDHAAGYPFPYSGNYTDYSEHQHAYCPKISGNIAELSGGGFYLNSGATSLYYYCVVEDPLEPNQAIGNPSSDNLDVEGGNVIIGDSAYHNHEVSSNAETRGCVRLETPILVNGGTVDIFGDMDNPRFTSKITVNITNASDSFIDHRRTINSKQDYKIHYTENFFGTGQYIANQYETADNSCEVIIEGVQFERKGYKIAGWNTKQDGSGITYSVGTAYDLCTLDFESGMGTTPTNCGVCRSNSTSDEHLLVLYAQWERKGYVITFLPNAPVDTACSGDMADYPCNQDEFATLPKNQFKCEGYKFDGWAYYPYSEVVFRDEATVYNLTMEDGGRFKLYAKWVVCTHTNLTYEADDNALIQMCDDCNGHKATYTVSAADVEFNGHAHPATVSGDSNWLNAPPVLTYVKTYDAMWDEADVDDVYGTWGVNTAAAPIYAGEYTAVLTANGVSAACVYTILPIRWATPNAPECVTTTISDKVGVLITSPVSESVHDVPQYQYGCQYLDGETLTELTWTDSTFIHTPMSNTFYYLYARALADRNHLASETSLSIRYWSGKADVHFLLEHGVKIDYASKQGDNTYTFVASVREGYHKNNWLVTIHKDDSESSGEVCVPNDGKYVLTNLDTSSVYYVKITGIAVDATVTTKAAPNQVFSEFTNAIPVTIGRSSAFTVQYYVKEYIPAEYALQELRFTTPGVNGTSAAVLPRGTTVIMRMDNDTYWYYTVGDSPTSSINLEEFSRMGQHTDFIPPATANDPINFRYQFIVDFSRAEQPLNVNKLYVSLYMGKNNDNTQSEAKDISSICTIDAVDEGSFVLDAMNDAGSGASITYRYTPSSGTSSVWDNRDAALVLTIGEGEYISSDLSLSVSTGGTTTTYWMKAGNRFIIPLGALSSEANTVTLRLSSNLVTSDTLSLTAQWLLSCSVADKAPLNGICVAETDVLCRMPDSAAPSVKIHGNQRLYTAKTVFDVGIESKNIPSDWRITAYLYRKDSNVDSSTYNQYLYTGYYQDMIALNTTAQTQISLLGHDAGSFYLLVTVTANEGANRVIMAQTRYYFIAQD